MKRFNARNRAHSMTVTVSFHDVPMPRGLAFAIRHIETRTKVAIFSADRRDKIIAEHNKAFGTNLHGQAWLVAAHARDPAHFAPANSPATTSHCYHSDGNPAYRYQNGEQIPSGGPLPWFMVGLDIADAHVTAFLHAARQLRYAFIQPYASGRERHHVVCRDSPIHALEQNNQISKNRH